MNTLVEFIPELFEQIIIALAIGGLIGLERESAPTKKYAGIRTITLIAISGPVAVKISKIMNSIVPVAIYLAMGSLISIFILYIRLKIAEKEIGVTTTATIFLISLTSILVGYSLYFEAVFITILTTILLTEKKPIHSRIEELTRPEISDALKVGVLAFIIYPLLPNEPITSYELINPRRTLQFVLIVLGIRFGLFLISRRISGRRSLPIAGFLGGGVSSLATAGALTDIGKDESYLEIASLGIILASISMAIRNVSIAVIASFEIINLLMIPLTLITIIGLLFSYRFWGETKEINKDLKDIIHSPLALRPALKLGFYFLIITILGNLANNLLGQSGIWVVALAGGLVSSAAVAISSVSLLSNSVISAQSASLMVIIGSISSMMVKIILSLASGNKKMTKKILPPIILMSLGGLIPFLLL